MMAAARIAANCPDENRQAAGQQQGRHRRHGQPRLLQQHVQENDPDRIALKGFADLGNFHCLAFCSCRMDRDSVRKR